MSNIEVDIIISDFKQKLDNILSSKEKHVKELNECDQRIHAKFDGSRSQSNLARLFEQQQRTLQTGINLVINSDELADKVHSRIKELIVDYPIEEVEWFKFIGTNKWHLKFNF